MENFNSTIIENSSCKNCLERHAACWGGCEKYKSWKSRIYKINKWLKECNEKMFMYNKTFTD